LCFVSDDKGRIFGPCTKFEAEEIAAFLYWLKEQYPLGPTLAELNEIDTNSPALIYRLSRFPLVRRLRN
jgi:hypothetical protein